MATREEKFKAFLQSLPEDKRQQLFVYLKNLNPTDRVKAIDTIIARTESGKASVPTASQPAAPQRPAPATNPTPVQKPQNASPVQFDMRSTSRPSANQAPNVAPVVKPVAPSRPANSQAPKPTNNQHRPNPEDKKASSSSATVISSKTKRDLLIVAVVLIVFTGICFAAKYIIDKKISNKTETTTVAISESLASEVASPVVEETATTTTAETTEVTPTPIPTPSSVPLNSNAPDLTGMVIVIDPGHQMETSYEVENVASWQTSTKKKATCGTVGKVTGIPEYELTLDIALITKDYLEQCGATVILTRYENDVNISNQERANIAVSSGADLFIRIHADAANDSLQSGVRVFVPDSGDYVSVNGELGNVLGQGVADSLGLSFIGTKKTSLYTGLNYANTVPSFQISLGLLSNSDDEAILINEDNQVQIAASIAEFAVELK